MANLEIIEYIDLMLSLDRNTRPNVAYRIVNDAFNLYKINSNSINFD